MKRLVLLAAPFLISATAADGSQGNNDAALEKQCRATEVAVPDSCGCTIQKARSVGVTDRELAALFKDDAQSSPIDQAQYSRYWQVKTQCLMTATMASLPKPGMPPAASYPAPMAVPAYSPPASPGAQQAARRRSSYPIPLTLTKPADDDHDRILYFTPDQTRAMLKSLEGTTWKRAYGGVPDFGDPKNTPEPSTYEFLPGRVLVFRTGDRVYRYKLVVSDEPGFDPDNHPIMAMPDGSGQFGYVNDANIRVPPYLATIDDKHGFQNGLWLGFWGGKTAEIAESYRMDQLYTRDDLVLVKGTPKPLERFVDPEG